MERLGFVEPPTTLRIFANRKNPPHLWYTIKDGEVVELPTNAVRGYLRAIKFENKERRGKEVTKLEIHLQADRPLIIESGYDSQFSKGFLVAIASLQPHQLEQPITIAPYAGDDEAVLFCRCYFGCEPIKAQYGEQTDWREVATVAIDTVKRSTGETLSSFAAPRNRVGAT